MKRILIVDSNEHQYKIRETLNKIGNFLIDNVNSINDFRLKLYENDPDLILYYTLSNVSIHDIIELMFNTDYITTPILFFKDNEINEFYNHHLLLGPFNIHEDSFEAIFNTGIKYGQIYSSYRETEDKLSTIEENCQNTSAFHDFSYFSAQVIQEFKKAKRFRHPLSLAIIQLDIDNELKEKYSEKTINDFMKKIVESIKSAIRETDIPMSYDTNKILILMPLTDEDGVNLAIERLHKNISNTIYKSGDIEIKTNATIGKATMNEETSKFSEMVKKAMKAFEKK